MKMTMQVNVMGMKASKGNLENGTPFDSTKLYTLVDMDSSKGTAIGQVSAEYTFGLSDEFQKYKHLPFPFAAAMDIEIVSNGKTQKTIVTGLRPITDQSVKAKV